MAFYRCIGDSDCSMIWAMNIRLSYFINKNQLICYFLHASFTDAPNFMKVCNINKLEDKPPKIQTLLVAWVNLILNKACRIII